MIFLKNYGAAPAYAGSVGRFVFLIEYRCSYSTLWYDYTVLL